MRYNWDGDVICHACAVERKRFVPGGRRPVATDIRQFVSPADDVVIKRILAGLAEHQGLPRTKDPGDFDRRALILWDHVARTLAYRADRGTRGDTWLFPSEVHALGRGDCEDASFLLASLLLGSGISPFNVRVVLGRLRDGRGEILGDHCWPMYKNELGEWCILEATRERAAWSLIRADWLADTGAVDYEPHFCFNTHHLWAVRHDRAHYPDIFSYLRGHRDRLVDLENPRFPSGGWLSAITGDNAPGHLELTTEALRGRGFTEDAIAVAADGSQDPDFYEWYHPEAHAQTACDPNTGATAQTAAQGIAAFQGWVGARTAAFLGTAEPDRALFLLGYLLHGLQDLASHQGLTNAQHAYASYVDPGRDEDGDHDPANRVVAARYCAAFLDRLLPRHPRLKALQSYRAGFSLTAPHLPRSEKARLLGVAGWDFSIPAYREYRALAAKYAAIQAANPRITWDRDAVLGQILP